MLLALEYQAGSRGFQASDRINTQGLKQLRRMCHLYYDILEYPQMVRHCIIFSDIDNKLYTPSLAFFSALVSRGR